MTDFVPGKIWRVIAKDDSKINKEISLDSNYFEELDYETYFDELVIDKWFHLEQLNEKSYWVRINELNIFVDFKDDENPEITIRNDSK